VKPIHENQSLEAIGRSTIPIGGHSIRVWPEYQPLVELGDPRILGTLFQDAPLVNASAGVLVRHAAQDLKATIRGFGGKKVRDLKTWNSPEFQLLTWRALILLARARRADETHVVNRWVNVMENGDYSSPHCHYEADAAVVYSLDPGDSKNAHSGRLQIIDPRIPICCPSRPEHPTRSLTPDFPPGAMIVFPAQFLHLVTPYEGHRSRMTVAWDLSVGPAPANLPDPTRQIDVIYKPS
jgi:hypothetical protein